MEFTLRQHELFLAFLKVKIMIVDIVISMVDAGVWLHNFNVCL